MSRTAGDSPRWRAAWAAIPWLASAALLVALQQLAIAPGPGPLPQAAPPVRGAHIGAGIAVSTPARQLADWIATTGDHAGAPFIIVDKKRASVLVFDAQARLDAHSVVLLGSALGDDSVPGIGTRPMAQILPAERTTPAGRFVAERGRNTHGEDVVWVDYDAAVSMHRLRVVDPAEQRAARMATPALDDNRISYGCINVPVAFYEEFIQPVFAHRKAMVYVLPDTKTVDEVFGALQAASIRITARTR